jgi:cyclopropane-fatty-acyl-phospholipid synthase
MNSLAHDINQYAGASLQAIESHYDQGVDFYKLWIGDDLFYTAAKFTDPLTGQINTDDYDVAQIAKVRHHFDAIGANEESTILDLGCGWGPVLRYASEAVGVKRAVGITLSPQQTEYVDNLGLENVDVHLGSYENFQPNEQFDGILTLGALEHFAKPGLSPENKIEIYRNYFSLCRSWLKPRGRLSLQCSTWDSVSRQTALRIVPNDVFPESDLAYVWEVLEAADPHFELHYYERSHEDYIRTIANWQERFDHNSDRIRQLVGTEVHDFHHRYLRRVIAGFKRRRIQLSRFVFVAR